MCLARGSYAPRGQGALKASAQILCLCCSMLMQYMTGFTGCECVTGHIPRTASSWMAISRMHLIPAIALTRGAGMQSLVGSRPQRAPSGMAPRGSASLAQATLARPIAPTAFPALLVCGGLYGVAPERQCFTRSCHHPLRISPEGYPRDLLDNTVQIKVLRLSSI